MDAVIIFEIVGAVVVSLLSAGGAAYVTIAKMTVHIGYLRSEVEEAKNMAQRAHRRIDKIPHP